MHVFKLVNTHMLINRYEVSRSRLNNISRKIQLAFIIVRDSLSIIFRYRIQKNNTQNKRLSLFIFVATKTIKDSIEILSNIY